MKPDSPGAIWVSLAETSWQYNGNGTRVNNMWNGVANGTQNPMPSNETSEFPEWNGRVQDLEVMPIP
jgi:hypothetical protein